MGLERGIKTGLLAFQTINAGGSALCYKKENQEPAEKK